MTLWIKNMHAYKKNAPVELTVQDWALNKETIIGYDWDFLLNKL